VFVAVHVQRRRLNLRESAAFSAAAALLARGSTRRRHPGQHLLAGGGGRCTGCNQASVVHARVRVQHVRDTEQRTATHDHHPARHQHLGVARAEPTWSGVEALRGGGGVAALAQQLVRLRDAREVRVPVRVAAPPPTASISQVGTLVEQSAVGRNGPEEGLVSVLNIEQRGGM
jgi:hypothetical protein